MGWFSQARALLSVRVASLKSESCFTQIPKLSTYIGTLLYFVSENAYAGPDIQTILNNVSRIIVPLTGVVLLFSYIGGVYMIIHALTMMKKFGNMSMQAQPGELAGPLMQLVVGAILIYLPTSTDTLSNSLFGSSNSIFGGSSTVNYSNVGSGSEVLGYVASDSFAQQWASMANTLVLYIQFVGFLSFVKGWFILSKSAGHGAPQDSVSKGITHIIGGLIAINFVAATNIIYNTIFGT
jgi:intracellular multiplication protein IcmC